MKTMISTICRINVKFSLLLHFWALFDEVQTFIWNHIVFCRLSNAIKQAIDAEESVVATV